MPAFFKRLIPSSSRYFSPYTTLFIPAWIISFEHSIQGEAVTYNVAFSLLLLLLASFVMAFASACSTYDFVTLFSSSHWFSKPLGVPLYPSLIIICFHDESSDLSSLTVTIFCPYSCHAQVPHVKIPLFVVFRFHCVLIMHLLWVPGL